MLCEILMVMLCFFAVLGIVDAATYLFDRVCSARLGISLGVLVPECSAGNAEYTLRYVEGVLAREGLPKAVDTVYLGKDVKIDPEILARLEGEFGNIRRLG